MTSGVQHQTGDCFLLANSLLAKFIKVSPSSSEYVKHQKISSSSSDNVQRYHIEIPVYEPITLDSSTWDNYKSKTTSRIASPSISGYHYWTYSKVPHYKVPIMEYHSTITWPSTMLSDFRDHLPSSTTMKDHQTQWTTPTVFAPSKYTSSYKYPIYIKQKSLKTEDKTPTSLFLIGKTKDFLIPPPSLNTKTDQLPMSLIALNNNNEPNEMLTVSEDKKFEIRRGPGKYSNHYYDGQKTFFHHQTDEEYPEQPFSETQAFEHFFHENFPNYHNSHQFHRNIRNNKTPYSIYEEYPYYMDDSFENFSSLLNPRQQKNTTFNWPHKSKYEPMSSSNQKKVGKKPHSFMIKAGNNSEENLPKLNLKNNWKAVGDQATFRPINRNHKEYFEMIRKRSSTTENSSHKPLKDNLMTANSVARQTKIKMNELSKNRKNVNLPGEINEEGEGETEEDEKKENISEYDKDKSAFRERVINSDDNYQNKDESTESTGDSPNEKKRTKWLKDKGYAKHGWKNVYHKEEWGEAKKYHDIWRFVLFCSIWVRF